MKRYTVIFILFIILIVIALVKYQSGAAGSALSNATPTATLTSPTPTLSPSPTPSAVPSLTQTQPPPSPTPTVIQAAPEASPTPTTLPPSPTPTIVPSKAAPTAAPTIAPTPTTAAPAQGATPTTAPTPTGETAGGCLNKAAFYDDVTIPDGTTFRQGEAFTKTWRLKNEGTCTWGPDYHLAFAGGDSMNGPQTLPLPKVNPGELFNLSVNLTSPANGGTYVGHWVFMDPQAQRFGVNSGGIDDIWVKIVVSYIVPGQDPKPTPNPAAPPPAAGPTGCTFTTNDAYVNQVLALINQARAKAGLPALILNPKLAAAAMVQSADMACHNFWGHTGSDGSTFYTRVRAQGYKDAYASENVYVGQPQFGGDAQGAFTWWWNSPVHHDNMMSSKVTEIGIGYAFTTTSDYGGYYTIDFGKPVFGK